MHKKVKKNGVEASSYLFIYLFIYLFAHLFIYLFGHQKLTNEIWGVLFCCKSFANADDLNQQKENMNTKYNFLARWNKVCSFTRRGASVKNIIAQL